MEYGCDSFRHNGVHDRKEVDHFGELIYDDKYGIFVFRLGKRANEVDRYDFLWGRWDFIWVKWCGGSGVFGFNLLTCVTSFDIGFNVFLEHWPIIFAHD